MWLSPSSEGRRGGVPRRPLLALLCLAGAALWTGALPPGTARAAPPQGASAGEDPAEEEFLKVNSLFNRELYDLAVPRYLKLLEKHPGFEKGAMVHYALALSYRALAADLPSATTSSGGDRERLLREAVRHAKAALAGRIESRREASEALARSLLELGDHEGATRVFEKLLEEAGGDERPRAAAGLADAHYQAGDHAAAARLYREALGLLDPEDEKERRRTTFHLALALYRQGEAENREAAGLFERLAEEEGDFQLDSLYMAALTRQKLDETDLALTRFRALASREERRWQEVGLYGEGTALFHAGDHEKAAAALEEFARRFPASEHRDHAELYLGRAFLKLGKLRSGARILNRLRASQSAGAEASLWLSRAYSSAGRHSASIKILEAAVAKYPSSPHREVIELERSIELLADGRTDESSAALEAFLERYPRSGSRDHALYLRAFALHQAGEYEASSRVCSAFLSSFSTSDFRREVEQLAAENRFLAGDHAAARRLYASYLSETPALSAKDKLLAGYRMAQSLFFEGDLEGARNAFDRLRETAGPELERAIREDPLFESYHYLLGDISYQLRDHERATRELRAYLEGTDPRHESDARFKLAHSLQLRGNHDEAREAYKAALASDSETPHALQIRFELGQIALEKKEHEEARAAFEKVVAGDPDSALAPHACHFLGWIAQQEGRHAEASDWFRKLADRFPGHERAPEARYLLALSLQAESRFDEAREVLRELEAKHPGADFSWKIRLQEGVALARQGQKEEAIEVFETLRKSELPPAEKRLLLYELAWCRRATGSPEKAIPVYREILADSAAASPDSDDVRPAARLELAELEFDRGNIREARDLLAPLAATAGPLREKALYRLAWCHYRAGDSASLARAHRELESAHPESELLRETSLLVARRLVEEKEFTEAAEIFRRIVEKHPGTEEADLALVSHAECLNEEGRFRESRKELETHLEKYPESPHRHRARFALGFAAEGQGELDQAIDHYKAAARGGGQVAARAQFQIGQCLASKKLYEDAIVEFLQVTTRYAYEEWSSRAVLQVAGCFEALDRPEKAREYYDEVIRKYPERDEARLARQRLAKILN